MKRGIKTAILWGILVITPLCITSQSQAQTQKNPQKDFVVALNESNIHDFLNEVTEITTGQRPDMMHDDAVDYFNNHISNKSKFKSVMRYQIPSFPTQDIDMKLNKEEYISMVLNGRHMLKDYKTKVEVQNLKINGRSATFKSITKEKGRMPWIKDAENKDDIEFIPIEGESICEQKLIISYNNFIQMAKADCSTTISFDPFAGKPLIPE